MGEKNILRYSGLVNWRFGPYYVWSYILNILGILGILLQTITQASVVGTVIKLIA